MNGNELPNVGLPFSDSHRMFKVRRRFVVCCPIVHPSRSLTTAFSPCYHRVPIAIRNPSQYQSGTTFTVIRNFRLLMQVSSDTMTWIPWLQNIRLIQHALGSHLTHLPVGFRQLLSQCLSSQTLRVSRKSWTVSSSTSRNGEIKAESP